MEEKFLEGKGALITEVLRLLMPKEVQML